VTGTRREIISESDCAEDRWRRQTAIAISSLKNALSKPSRSRSRRYLNRANARKRAGIDEGPRPTVLGPPGQARRRSLYADAAGHPLAVTHQDNLQCSEEALKRNANEPIAPQQHPRRTTRRCLVLSVPGPPFRLPRSFHRITAIRVRRSRHITELCHIIGK